MKRGLVWHSSCVLVALLAFDVGRVLCQNEDKRQDLVPFPRIGKRQGLIPFPRIGRSVGAALGGSAQLLPPSDEQMLFTPDDEENWELPIDMTYMIVPRYPKRGGHSSFTPRIGRKKRSVDDIGGDYGSYRRAAWPEDIQALFRRTMRQLIPSPRIGRAEAFVPRLGKKSMGPVEAEDDDYMVKRGGPSAFTPRIGRASFTPRIGRSNADIQGQMRVLRTFTPRIGK